MPRRGAEKNKPKNQNADKGVQGTPGHALCRSYSKVEESALTATPKFEGGPARDL